MAVVLPPTATESAFLHDDTTRRRMAAIVYLASIDSVRPLAIAEIARLVCSVCLKSCHDVDSEPHRSSDY